METKMSRTLRIKLIGGGLAGLGAAIALSRRRFVVRFTVAILVLLASYVIAFPGFDAVVRNAMEPSRKQQESGLRWMPLPIIPGL